MKALGHLGSALTTAWLWLGERLRTPPAAPSEPRRILVIGYAAIGDFLFLLPALEGLRKGYPRAKITFIANRYPTTEELLPATGLVDEVWFHEWEGPLSSNAEKASINRSIREAGFDLAVLSLSAPAHYFQTGLRDIPVRAAHLRSLEPVGAGWPWPRRLWRRARRALFTGEFARRVLVNRPAWVVEGEHAMRRNLRLLAALGIPEPAWPPRPRLPIAEKHRQAVAGLLPASGRKRVGVHLGAPGGAYGKMWDPDRFGSLCARLAAESWVDIVLVGGPEEEPSVATFLERCAEAKSLVGKCSLLETVAAIETCLLFLSNDTGLAKAAMLLGVPTATWWGPSDPSEYGVVWEPEKHLDIRTGIWCSPCSRMGMPREGKGILNYTFCGHHDCLKKLESNLAWRALLDKYGALLGARVL